ncbi:hypothetical protein B0H13DRAFT_1861517 [Mycena leptocephala]|nr:hypothetical protein B0H13DRAFT_1861517 [Mycena leptocephala]
MDNHSANDEFTCDHPQFTSAGSQDGGGNFSGSHHFTVAGGTFNNTTNYSTPTIPSDFRMIPTGDIDLQHEIRLNKLEGPVGVGCRPERASVRHVYSARIDSRNAPTTVAMYQGPGAEEMFGAASSGGVHATLFHGGIAGLLFLRFSNDADLVPSRLSPTHFWNDERPIWQGMFPLNVPLSLVVGGVNSATADLSQSGRKAAYTVQQGRNSQCERMTLRYRTSELEVRKYSNCVHRRLQVGSPTAAASHIIISRIESDENTAVVNLESTKMLQRPFNGNVRQLAS